MLMVIYAAIPAFAQSTVGTSTVAAASRYSSERKTCFSNGYYFVFWSDGTNIVYSASSTGTGSWSAKTTVRAATSGIGFTISCPSDNNIYYAYGDDGADHNVFFRYGSSSGGVITWTVSEATISTLTQEFPCQGGCSIYATSTTNIWIGVSEQDSVAPNHTFTQVMYCAGTCGTAGNWASKDDLDFGSTSVVNIIMLALSTTAKAAYIFGNSVQKVRYTTNTGTSWTSSSATAGSYTLSQSEAVNIGDTVYCACFKTDSHFTFWSYPIGGSLSSENNIASVGSSNVGLSLSTDSNTDFVVAFQDSSTLTTIDTENSQDTGVTWTAGTLATGENTLTLTGAGISGTFTLQSTVAGVQWQTTAATATIRYDVTPALTITVTATVTAIAVTGCTAFELGCWLYPVFTILMVAVVVIGEARFIKVPKGDYTGLFLEASAMGGLICVLFGILNVMVPVIILLMQIVRAIAK